MKRSAWLMVTALTALALSGCLGSDGDAFDYRPGKDWKPTGNTVRLKATVLDLIRREPVTSTPDSWGAPSSLVKRTLDALPRLSRCVPV